MNKLIHRIVDDWIPFCEIFIIPYLLWFIYVAAVLVFLFFQTKHIEDFYKCATILVMGMTTSLIIYTFFPNAQNMRPVTFERKDILQQPGFYSVAIHVAIVTSNFFKNKKWAKNSSLILCILICMSTLFLKQHSFVDLVCAVILYLFYYTIIYRQAPADFNIPYKNINSRQRLVKNIKHRS